MSRNPLKVRIERPDLVKAVKSVNGIEYQQDLDGSIMVHKWMLDEINNFGAANGFKFDRLAQYLQLMAGRHKADEAKHSFYDGQVFAPKQRRK